MQDIDSRKKKLDRFFERASAVEISDEIRADLAKHGSVLICGFVERCVEIVVLDRLTGRAHPRVTKFIRSHFKKGTNYDCEAISQLVARFDLEWEAKLRTQFTAHPSWVESLRTAYTLRNAIAHGVEGNRGLNGVLSLYKDAKKIVDALITSTA